MVQYTLKLCQDPYHNRWGKEVPLPPHCPHGFPVVVGGGGLVLLTSVVGGKVMAGVVAASVALWDWAEPSINTTASAIALRAGILTADDWA